LTVLQAIALSEGLGPKAAKGRAMLIRVGRAGERVEIPVNLGDVISGRQSDPAVQPKDVIFVPSSTMKSVALGTVDALVRMITLRGVL
jgi:protein involved in polysaccharide export with SLBB domain